MCGEQSKGNNQKIQMAKSHEVRKAVIRMAGEIINAKRVKRIDTDGNVKIYDSVNMAAEDNHIYANQISRSVRLGKTVKGYRYEYV